MTPERCRQIEDLYHAAQENGAGILAGAASDLRQEVERLFVQNSDDKILDQPLSEFFESDAEIQVAAGS
jgi:hypothetical protein